MKQNIQYQEYHLTVGKLTYKKCSLLIRDLDPMIIYHSDYVKA